MRFSRTLLKPNKLAFIIKNLTASAQSSTISKQTWSWEPNAWADARTPDTRPKPIAYWIQFWNETGHCRPHRRQLPIFLGNFMETQIEQLFSVLRNSTRDRRDQHFSWKCSTFDCAVSRSNPKYSRHCLRTRTDIWKFSPKQTFLSPALSDGHLKSKSEQIAPGKAGHPGTPQWVYPWVLNSPKTGVNTLLNKHCGNCGKAPMPQIGSGYSLLQTTKNVVKAKKNWMYALYLLTPGRSPEEVK